MGHKKGISFTKIALIKRKKGWKGNRGNDNYGAATYTYESLKKWFITKHAQAKPGYGDRIMGITIALMHEKASL